MTQALINSLNKFSDKTVSLAEKIPNTDGMDFAKIYQIKTDNAKPENNDKKQVFNAGISKNDIQDDVKNLKTDNEIINDYDISKDTDTDSITQDTTLNYQTENEEETDTNIMVVLPVNINVDKNKDDVTTVITGELVITEEKNPETDTITTEENTNITEEDPTMYNELNTLEDPTALFMLQSQIQQAVKNTTDKNNSDLQEPEGTLLNSNSKNQATANNNSNTILKQFEYQDNAKDLKLDVAMPKEQAHLKSSNSTKLSSVINENIIKELNVEVLSSQSADAESSMGDFMQKQSPQEQAVRVMIQGDVKYETIESEVTRNTVQIKSADAAPSKILEQITKQLDGMFNNSKLNMILNPESLGKVNLQLLNTKEGLIAQFTATTQEARDAIMKGINSLKENLLAQGVNVDSVSVKLEESDGEYELDYTEQENSNGGYQHQGAKKQKEESKDFEKMMFDAENNEGSV